MKKIWDILSPVTNTKINREEYLLVEFNGFVKNIYEAYAYAMLKNIDTYKNEYPKLLDLCDKLPEELFEATVMHDNLHKFMYELSGFNPDVSIKQDIEALKRKIDYHDCVFTQFEISLFILLHEEYVKNCVFYSSNGFTEAEIDYITHQFSPVMNKIQIVGNGYLKDAIKELRPTTIFTNDLDFVLNDVDTLPDEVIANQMYIVRNNFQNAFYNNDTESFYLKDMDKIEEVNEKRLYGVTRMFAYPIETIVEVESDENDLINN